MIVSIAVVRIIVVINKSKDFKLNFEIMKEGRTQSMDKLVNLVLKQMGLEQKFKEREICEVWPEVVGQMIASRTKQLDVANGKLFVTFTSAVVKNEIMMVKEGLVRALNEKVGSDVVKEIIICG